MIWEVIVSDDYLIFGNIRQKYFIFDQHAAQKILKDNSIIDRISSSVHNSDPTAELFLYGSRARGDNRPDSDWDILILVDNLKITNELEDKFRNTLYDIELESGQIISTLIYPKDYWKTVLQFSPLYRDVYKEGLRL